jgi:hypothetical protein
MIRFEQRLTQSFAGLLEPAKTRFSVSEGLECLG